MARRKFSEQQENFMTITGFTVPKIFMLKVLKIKLNKNLTEKKVF